MIEVLQTGYWLVHRGVVGAASTGIDGQLTKLKIDGVLCYVRENVACKGFGMSSNERMGLKRGSVNRSNEVLELCCEGDWASAAAKVREADARQRPVVSNRQFTATWAESVLRKADRLHAEPKGGA